VEEGDCGKIRAPQTPVGKGTNGNREADKQKDPGGQNMMAKNKRRRMGHGDMPWEMAEEGKGREWKARMPNEEANWRTTEFGI
jgi:hypothetical protein